MEYFVLPMPCLMQNHTIIISLNPAILTKTHKLMQNQQFYLSALEIICLYSLPAFVVVQPYYIFKMDSSKYMNYLGKKNIRLIQRTIAKTVGHRPVFVHDFCPPTAIFPDIFLPPRQEYNFISHPIISLKPLCIPSVEMNIYLQTMVLAKLMQSPQRTTVLVQELPLCIPCSESTRRPPSKASLQTHPPLALKEQYTQHSSSRKCRAQC